MLDFTPIQIDTGQNAVTTAHAAIADLHPAARVPAALLAVNLFQEMLVDAINELDVLIHEAPDAPSS